MPRIRSALPEGSVSIEQIVSYNFQRAREERGWTQVEVSDRLIPLLGYELRQAGVSTIETCGRGNRRRAFAANELLAFAQCFDLPLGWWFIPSPEWAGRPCDPSNVRLLDVVVGSDNGWAALVKALAEFTTALELTGQPAPWAAALTSVDSARRSELQESLLLELSPSLDRQIHALATLVAQLEATTLVAALRAAPRPTGD